MKIAIAGAGYVGLVTAACLAEKGHQVFCFDTDAEKIRKLNNQEKNVIFEAGLDELLLKNQSRLSFSLDYRQAYADSDIIFICVGTPEKKDGSANLTYVFQVAQQIADNISKDCIVVVKSTVPIGTNEKLERFFIDALNNKNLQVHIVSNPEFLAQGTAVKDTLHASRIIIGTDDKSAQKILEEVYRNFDCPKVFVSRKSAEMIKYASNDFLALKISYINEIANLCEKLGADIEEVSHGMGFDARIGSQFLRAGIGYGGSCFPKDTKALHWLSNFHDHELKTIKAAIEVNDKQKLLLIKKSYKYFESFSGLNIAVLGLTFKPDTDDLRDAPSLSNIPLFLDDGATVRAYDPIGVENFKKLYPNELIYCDTIDATITNADLCFIFTEWEIIKNYPLKKYVELMKKAIILDGRNCYKVNEAIATAGIVYESVGRKCIDNR